MREKVGKSRFTVFFQWFVAPEGRKVGSLKRRVRSQLARGEMKNCTPLWREAHFQVKMWKTLGVRTTFGTWDVEKVHAVVARSTFPSRNVKNTPFSDHFWKLRCRKSARRCGAKHISKSKCYKALGVRTTFGSWDVEKVHAVVARSTFRSQNVQSTRGADHFWQLRCRKSARRCGAKHISKSKCTKHTMYGPLLEVQMLFRVAGARDCAPCQKWPKRQGFVEFPRMMAGMGDLKRICKDPFRVAGAVQQTCSSEMSGGQGALISWEGLHFGASESSGFLRWFCVTRAALRMTWRHFFVAGAVL